MNLYNCYNTKLEHTFAVVATDNASGKAVENSWSSSIQDNHHLLNKKYTFGTTIIPDNELPS